MGGFLPSKPTTAARVDKTENRFTASVVAVMNLPRYSGGRHLIRTIDKAHQYLQSKGAGAAGTRKLQTRDP